MNLSNPHSGACAGGHAECLYWLLESNAQTCFMDLEGKSPLLRACLAVAGEGYANRDGARTVHQGAVKCVSQLLDSIKRGVDKGVLSRERVQQSEKHTMQWAKSQQCHKMEGVFVTKMYDEPKQSTLPSPSSSPSPSKSTTIGSSFGHTNTTSATKPTKQRIELVWAHSQQPEDSLANVIVKQLASYEL